MILSGDEAGVVHLHKIGADGNNSHITFSKKRAINSLTISPEGEIAIIGSFD